MEKRFSDKEAAMIIKKALEIQHGTEESTQSSSGIARDELFQIAEETGIERFALEQALEMQSGNSETKNKLLGGDPVVREQFRVESDADEEAFRAILSRIEFLKSSTLANIPIASASSHIDANGLSWKTDLLSTMQSGECMQIDVRREGKFVTCRILDDMRKQAGGLFGGIGGGLGLGLGFGFGFGFGFGALNSPLFAVLFAAGSIVGSLLLSRGLFQGVSKRRARKRRELATEIRQMLESSKETPQ